MSQSPLLANHGTFSNKNKQTKISESGTNQKAGISQKIEEIPKPEDEEFNTNNTI